MGTLRVSFVVLLALAISVGPAYRHLAGGRQAYLPKWAMFSGMATGFIAVKVQQLTDGQRREVPWEDFAPRSRNKEGPVHAQRIARERDLDHLIRRYCVTHRGDGELFVTAKLSTRRGWKMLRDGTQDECTSPSLGRRGWR